MTRKNESTDDTAGVVATSAAHRILPPGRLNFLDHNTDLDALRTQPAFGALLARKPAEAEVA